MRIFIRGVRGGFVCDIFENVHRRIAKTCPNYKHKGLKKAFMHTNGSVISNIVSCVFKARPWTAISAPQLKQEGPVRLPL